MEIDHFAIGVPDLDEAIEEYAPYFGNAIKRGGRHPDFGTHNALVGIGENIYLEFIAPDKDAPEPKQPRPVNLDNLVSPGLATWIVRSDNLDAAVRKAIDAGYDPGIIVPASRTTPDGETLTWRLTVGAPLRDGGPIPFLIDWQDTPHPSTTAPSESRLHSFKILSPRHESLNEVFAALGIDQRAEPHEIEQMQLTLQTPKGLLNFESAKMKATQ